MVMEYPDALVRPSEPGDARVLANHLRPEDYREVRALRDGNMSDLLVMSIASSDPCYSAFTSGGALAMIFGVAPHPTEDKTGIVWLLGTTDMAQLHYRFLRESKSWLDRLFGDRYEILFNIADKRNTLHLDWLRWLGFKFMKEIPAGRNRELFIEFYKSKDV